MVAKFADISHYQTINLDAYFSVHDRIALKVSEATGFTDSTFAARYAYCRAHGHPAVLYHFDRAKFSGAEQFDWFMATIRRAGGPRPFPLDLLCLDSEDTNYPAGAVASAKGFTARAVAQGFGQGSVYTGGWYANPHGITAAVVQPGWRRLWVSDYSVGQADSAIEVPNGWARSQIIARQFTDGAVGQGRVYVSGVGYCDYNRVLSEWLGGEGEDMDAEQDRKLTYVYDQIRGAVAPGQRDFQGTMESVLTTTQGLVNLVNSKTGALGSSITDSRSAVLAAVAVIPAAHLEDAQIAEIAAAVSKLAGPTGGGVTSVEVEAALRHVFASAGG